jgi:hypothetical protein
MAPTADRQNGTEQQKPAAVLAGFFRARRKPVQLAIAWKSLGHHRFISQAWFTRPEPCKKEEKVMKTTGFSGLVCVALAMFALPATAQTPDGMTPAIEGMCDVLADATPGLYGLCVGMCEAQDCEAELSPSTEEVEFSPSCNPSSERLLANYIRLAGPLDPPMPCVKVACPCWTQAELEDIGGIGADSCIGGEDWMYLQSGAADRGVGEYATASYLSCTSNEAGFSQGRFVRGLSADEYGACLKTVTDQCTARELWP